MVNQKNEESWNSPLFLCALLEKLSVNGVD